MSKDRGPQCKECRSSGMKLYLKGDRCYIEDKCAIKRRPYPPGHLGRMSRRDRNASEYSIQLKEKQRARRMYGLAEVQFKRYYEYAANKRGITGEILFQTIERRLDNVVYRLGFGASRRTARQLVRHRHITVNGNIVDIPSFQVSPNDKIAVKESSKKNVLVRDAADAASRRGRIPAWLETNPLELKGSVLELPIGDKLDIPFESHLIVEFYSR